LKGLTIFIKLKQNNNKVNIERWSYNIKVVH